MTTINKLEAAFGKIEQSNWLNDAEQWKNDLPWLKYSQQIALQIVEHLDDKGISQKKFAGMLSLSPQVVNKWLQGKANFTLETIAKLEQVLDINLILVVEHKTSSKLNAVWLNKTEKEEYMQAPIINKLKNNTQRSIVKRLSKTYSHKAYAN